MAVLHPLSLKMKVYRCMQQGKSNGVCIGNMRDKHYPNRTIRIAGSVWEAFKEARLKSGKTWNMFIRDLLGMKPRRLRKFR